MADYFTQFSCIFDVGSAENAAAADAIRSELAAELDRDEGADLGFEMEVDHEHGPGALWISSDEQGEPEHVMRFVLRCAEAFDLRLGFHLGPIGESASFGRIRRRRAGTRPRQTREPRMGRLQHLGR